MFLDCRKLCIAFSPPKMTSSLFKQAGRGSFATAKASLVVSFPYNPTCISMFVHERKIDDLMASRAAVF